MIYRILIDQWFFIPGLLPDRSNAQASRMGGAAGGLWNSLGQTMDDCGLRAPSLSNPRARFYFTEAGWKQVGLAVAARARRLGHVVRVMRQKEPLASQVIYRDTLQLAILPSQRQRGRYHPLSQTSSGRTLTD